MKKWIAAALAFASLGSMATPAQTVQSSKTVRNEAVKGIKPPIQKQHAKEVNSSGALLESDPGLSPKDYGQRLQALGKQKWTKRKCRK